VEHLIEQSGLGRQLERYPLFSVFEHTDGKLKAGSIHPSIGKHLCGSVVALDDSLASARATLAGLGLRHAIVRAFEFSDRRERERHFDGNRIFEISSWSKLLKSRQVINRVKRPTVEFSNSDVAPQESRKEQQKRLANECLGIISRLGGVPGELLLGGGVSVALSCREFRSPSADFDFNIYLPGVPDIPGVLLASDDVRALSQSCSQPMSQSAKMSFSIEEGLRVDMIFVRRIPIGPWIVESRIDDYLRARALLSHVADRPILLVPREMVVFEKLLAARGLEVGKHDLFDVLSELETSAPTGDVFRHLIQVQRIGTSEAYLVAGAGVRAKREAIIAELISRLGEVQLLCRGLHRDSELYSNYLKRMERQLVIDRSADLISFLKDLEADSAMMSHNSEGTSDCAALRIANDAGGLQ
jgi:hypothetical protein